jgi:hypothetical protein
MKRTTETVTLANGRDAYNFSIGMPLSLVHSNDGTRLMRAGRWRSAIAWASTRWLRITRWWRPRHVVCAIDAEIGAITLVEERWSWLRWKWVRQ